MRRIKPIIIWIAVILLVVVSATFVLARSFNSKPKYEFYTVRKGAVTKSISVSGSVVSNQKLELSFLSPGIVKIVKVKVGDQVKAGDLLVALDDSLLLAQARGASAALSAAQAMLNKAQNNLRSVDRNLLDQGLANARNALEIAKRNLQDAYTARDNETNGAGVALNNAQSAYNDVLNVYQASLGGFNQAVEIAKVALGNALNSLSIVQSNYNYILGLYNSGRATFAELQQAQMSLSNANAAYNSARANYDAAIRQSETQKASALASLHAAEMQLSSARFAYDSALSGADIKLHSAENVVSSAQAAYDLANAQYNQSTAPVRDEDIASASAQVASSSASLRTVQIQIDRMKIKAPIDGTVTAVNSKVGELAGLAGSAVVLETVGDYAIETNIAETDIDQIKMGQGVIINFDSLPNLNVRGVIAKIDPAATVILGVINYKITTVLEELVNNLKPSMTADLEILTDSRENVLFVPRSALTHANETYTAKVLVDNKVIDKPIEVGLVGDSEIEITSGLAENDQIVLKQLR